MEKKCRMFGFSNGDNLVYILAKTDSEINYYDRLFSFFNAIGRSYNFGGNTGYYFHTNNNDKIKENMLKGKPFSIEELIYDMPEQIKIDGHIINTNSDNFLKDVSKFYKSTSNIVFPQKFKKGGESMAKPLKNAVFTVFCTKDNTFEKLVNPCLTVLRHDTKLGFIGGKIEKGETMIEAAVREFKEETGISFMKAAKMVNLDTTKYDVFEENLGTHTIYHIVYIVDLKTLHQLQYILTRNKMDTVQEILGFNLIPIDKLMKKTIPTAGNVDSFLEELHNKYFL